MEFARLKFWQWRFWPRIGSIWNAVWSNLSAIATVLLVPISWVVYTDTIRPVFDRERLEVRTQELQASIKFQEVQQARLEKENATLTAEAQALREEKAKSAQDIARLDSALAETMKRLEARTYEQLRRDALQTFRKEVVGSCLPPRGPRWLHDCLQETRTKVPDLKAFNRRDGAQFDRWLKAIPTVTHYAKGYYQRLATRLPVASVVSDPDALGTAFEAGTHLLLFETATQRMIDRVEPPNVEDEKRIEAFLSALSSNLGVQSDEQAPTTDVTLVLSAQPRVVARTGRPTLNWRSANATECTPSGDWTGEHFAPTGTLTLGPINVTSTYSMQCSGPRGSSPLRSVTVTISR